MPLKTKTDIQKKQLIQAMRESLGVVTVACKKVGCSRNTFYEYYRDDAEFRDEINNVDDYALDFVESQLFKLIKEGDKTAIIFYLKTKGQKRGYIEKQQIEQHNYFEPLPKIEIMPTNQEIKDAKIIEEKPKQIKRANDGKN